MRRLAIVGSWPENRHLIPWGDEMTDIWAFNEAPQKDWFERWDACFQLHTERVYSSPENWINKAHWDWLQQPHGKPIYMQAVDPRVPDSVEYPLEAVLSMIPYRYIRSSIAYALALAIYLDCYDEIGLWGINLASNTEYGYQATNMAFWIGFAHGRGINLVLHCWMDEFNQRLYGYEGEYQLGHETFSARINEIKPVNANNWRVLQRSQNDINDAMLKHDFHRVAKLIIDLETIATATGESDGALAEAERYAARVDDISRQEFERAAAQAQMDGESARARMYHSGGQAEYVWNVWTQTGNIQALNQLRNFLKTKTEMALQFGRMLGVHHENVHYMNEYDAGVVALGGQRAVAQYVK